MRILFPASDWASNIGNPFFTLGVKHAVEAAFPKAEVVFTASNPIMAKGLKGRGESMAFNYPSYLGEVDAIMFAGPMLDKNFGRIFGPALRAAKHKKMKIFLVSAGGIEYDDEEIRHCRDALSQIRPDILYTRDRETFEFYGDLAKESHSGVCGAWFVPDYYPGYDTPELKPYITSVYDTRAEPPLASLNAAIGNADFVNVPVYSGRYKGWISRILDRKEVEKADRHMIVRPCHRPTNPNFAVFSKPNTFASYTPYGYLNLYRNTTVTVTDRLHAAVATLAYGNPAYLTLRSNRVKLLNAAGVEYKYGKRLVVDSAHLGSLKEGVISFLRGAIKT